MPPTSTPQTRFNRWLYTQQPALRRLLTRAAYELVSAFDTDVQVRFLNYGYAELDPRRPRLALAPAEERYRYEIQLYDHIARAVDWTGRDALEVSSGRGGGAHYIKRRYQPKTLLGVDLSSRAVKFCQRYYTEPGLAFVQGDAEQLDFADQSFDIVLNVEAAFYYPHLERFFAQVVRLLRPGGHFLYADLRYVEDVPAWQAHLDGLGLQLVCAEDITPQVVLALAAMRAERRRLVERYVPRPLRGMFAQLAGVTGAGLAQAHPQRGERVYRNYVFRAAN